MKKLLLVLLIVFVQETVTLNGLLVKVHEGSFSAFWTTIFFVLASVIDIFVGYWLGGYVKRRWNKGKVRTFAKTWVGRFKKYIGKHGRKLYLLLFGYFSFPYLNAFICSWLDIPFPEAFMYLFFGNLVFYITCWLLVLGVMSVIPNPLVAFGVVLLLTIGMVFLMRLWRSRKI